MATEKDHTRSRAAGGIRAEVPAGSTAPGADSAASRANDANLPSPLDGMRVLEVANFLAAPSAAALMSDMGATVVKVEPLDGDIWRHLPPDLEWEPGAEQWNPGFHLDNRGKRSIAIDLGQPEGQEIVRRLAKDVDVFITNLTPARAKRYGLTYTAIRRRSARVVYLQLTGYGAHGPDRDQPGFDDVAFWASSGIMAGLGEPGQPPVQNRASIGDHTTCLALLSGVLAALLQRARTGRGQQLQASLLATGLWAFGDEIQGLLETGRVPRRGVRSSPSIPTHNSYQLRDGSWIMIAMAMDRLWPRLCHALDLDALAADPGLATGAGLMARSREITAILEQAFATKTLREITRRFRGKGLIWSPVAEPRDVIRNPQVAANDMLADLPGADYRTVNMPVRFGGSRVEPRWRAPEAGEHTDELLAEAGYDAGTIAALRETGVVRGG